MIFQWNYNNISSYPNCEVVDNGNPHIRVGFQAEGEYGGADEEHRDYSNRLSKVFFSLSKFFFSLSKVFFSLRKWKL